MASERRVRELPFILRAIWFFLLGWEITAVCILVAWFANLTIIGLPLGLWMLAMVPTVLTLKSRGGTIVEGVDGSRSIQAPRQRFILIRAIYFIFIGWWFSLIWSIIGYFLCVSIIGLPFGLWMLNRIPKVTTLRRSA